MTESQQDTIDGIVFKLEQLILELNIDLECVIGRLDDEQRSVVQKQIKDISSAARTLRELE